MKTKFTLNEMNEMLPATQSWNGKNLVSSSPVEIRSMYADSYYIIKAGNKTISLPESKGFWLDGGVELIPSKITPGVSKVYIKEDNNILLKQVDSVELVNEFIEYDYLCNTTNHNYILDDFLLHNFDLQDLKNAGWFACGNVDKTKPECCGDWEDLNITWRQTKDAWFEKVLELYLASTGFSIRWVDVQNGEYNRFISAWNDDFMQAIVDYSVAGERYFNSFLCPNEQQTGISQDAITGWTYQFEEGNTDYVYTSAALNATPSPASIDFAGSTVPNQTLYDQYRDTQLALGGAYSKLLKIITGYQTKGPDSTTAAGFQGRLTWANRNYNTDFVNKTRYITKKTMTVGNNETITHNLGTNNIDVILYRNSNGDWIKVNDNDYDLSLPDGDFNNINVQITGEGGTYKIIVVGLDESKEQIVDSIMSTDFGCTPLSNPGE